MKEIIVKKKTIHPDGLVRRPTYSHVVKAGNTIYIAGQVSRDPNGNIVGLGNFRVQAERVIENLQLALKAAGATLDDVVKTTIYLTNMAYRPILAEVTIKYFGSGEQPAATLLMVSSLAEPEFLLEIEAIAFVQ